MTTKHFYKLLSNWLIQIFPSAIYIKELQQFYLLLLVLSLLLLQIRLNLMLKFKI